MPSYEPSEVAAVDADDEMGMGMDEEGDDAVFEARPLVSSVSVISGLPETSVVLAGTSDPSFPVVETGTSVPSSGKEMPMMTSPSDRVTLPRAEVVTLASGYPMNCTNELDSQRLCKREELL